jgi:hypothetical protein
MFFTSSPEIDGALGADQHGVKETEKGLAVCQRKLSDRAMRTILLIVLILLLIGAFPAWPYSAGWGYYPVGGIGLVLLILIILLFMRRV